jgi:divalent metal cation (Fe/Co/Zn/Cd) transporter
MENVMGYGFGAFLVVVGLVLALAVTDTVSGVDLTMVGWIMALVGLGVLILSAVTMNAGRRTRSVATTVHPDGSQTVQERRTDI